MEALLGVSRRQAHTFLTNGQYLVLRHILRLVHTLSDLKWATAFRMFNDVICFDDRHSHAIGGTRRISDGYRVSRRRRRKNTMHEDLVSEIYLGG